MKKTFILWLTAVTAVIAGIFVMMSLKTNRSYFRVIAPINPADTVTRPGALFNDPVITTGFDVNTNASYKNLRVFIITGNVTANDKKYTTLQAALATKMVTVRETGDVNELKIDNYSSSYVYINSGDIVKGGQQDRTIQYDVIIPPHVKDIELASFCVEHGRWHQRENEEVNLFAKSESSLSSKELKMAAKHAKSQQEVWNKVSKYQRKANDELNKAASSSKPVEVRSPVSESSLQLTLDNEQIKQSKETYRQQLVAALKDRKDATGLAYYINGKLYSIDLYNNHQLFADLFDKLLDAAITEAISEKLAPADNQPLPDLDKLLHARAKVYEDLDVNAVTRFQSSEAGSFRNLVIFTTIDKTANRWLHRNWLDKTED